jgi:dynein heavy chain, axonemal
MQLRDWVIKGLPSDTVSQENSIFVSQGYRWPLMIDPQLQASRWIKNMESSNLQIVKFVNSNFISIMSNAISNGTAVMIEDVDETLDPAIDSVLAKAFYESEGRVLIRFADSDIMYHKDFRLYMNTKKPNPNYLPEIFIKVTVVNFTATFEGLEDQLLADVVKNERPEVEQQKDDNVKNLASFRKKIVDSEKNILRLLAEANAEKILDDVTLITTLEFSKNTAIEIEI